MERETHTIDATDKTLGRLATKIAFLLQGKHKPDYVPNLDKGDFVVVKNVDKIRLTGKKLKDKMYYRHSGYLGSLKKTPLGKILEQDPAKILTMAVMGMLPKNKLRKQRIKRLRIDRYG